jgi:hypothetical protein
MTSQLSPVSSVSSKIPNDVIVTVPSEIFTIFPVMFSVCPSVKVSRENISLSTRIGPGNNEPWECAEDGCCVINAVTRKNREINKAE